MGDFLRADISSQRWHAYQQRHHGAEREDGVEVNDEHQYVPYDRYECRKDKATERKLFRAGLEIAELVRHDKMNTAKAKNIAKR